MFVYRKHVVDKYLRQLFLYIYNICKVKSSNGFPLNQLAANMITVTTYIMFELFFVQTNKCFSSERLPTDQSCGSENSVRIAVCKYDSMKQQPYRWYTITITRCTALKKIQIVQPRNLWFMGSKLSLK